MLEAEGIGHYEEPCPYWELEQTKASGRRARHRCHRRRAGLRDCRLDDMIAMRAVDIVQPDIMYLGGMTRTLKLRGSPRRRD